MILTAHQPVYLPWLGLFHKIALADRYVCYDHVALSAYDYTARNTVNSATGPLQLIVPLKRPAGGAQALCEVMIDNAAPWQRKHWKTLQMAYAKAPFFAAYADFLQQFYATRWQGVSEMNSAMLAWLLAELGIPRQIDSSTRLDIQAPKGEGVLEMSRKLGADVFIFGAQGEDYADVAAFRAAQVRPVFQHYRHPVYPQVHGSSFQSHLSVLDLLFNCGPDSLEILMSGNLTRAQLEAGHDDIV